MPNLSSSEIKHRLKSIKSISKATKAMELMASLKMSAAIERMERSEEYFSEVHNSLHDVALSVKGLNHPFTKQREIKKTCIAIISAERGFCGGYNSNLINQVKLEMDKKDAIFLPLGKKAKNFILKNNLSLINNYEQYNQPIDKFSMKDLRYLSFELTNQFKEKLWDELIIVYTHFHSMVTQTPVSLKILPLFDDNTKEVNSRNSILYEPSMETVLDNLVPKFIFGLIYGAITQAYASEIAARKMAMDTANKNAKELIDLLQIQFNRLRQEQITQELSEIIGSSKNANKEENYEY